jgi:hypothetical protein
VAERGTIPIAHIDIVPRKGKDIGAPLGVPVLMCAALLTTFWVAWVLYGDVWFRDIQKFFFI